MGCVRNQKEQVVQMKYATEVTGGIWYGVTLPEWLRFFDCRASEEWLPPKAPWGESLWSGERAQVDLGLKRGYGENDATVLVSCQTYIDSRSCCHQELARQVNDMVVAADRFRREYEENKLKVAKPNEGGSCFYLPIAAELSNFGWGIIADKRSCIVVAFR